jgi:hypothetical protein
VNWLLSRAETAFRASGDGDGSVSGLLSNHQYFLSAGIWQKAIIVICALFVYIIE